MKNIIPIIIDERGSVKKDITILAMENENCSKRFSILLPNSITSEWLYIEFEKSNGDKFVSPRLEVVNGYIQYDLGIDLLDQVGKLICQVIARDENMVVWKSNKFDFSIPSSINATEEVVAKSPDILDDLYSILIGLDKDIKAITGVGGGHLATDEDVANLSNRIKELEQTNETDPTVPEYVKNITEADIEEWNNKVDSDNKAILFVNEEYEKSKNLLDIKDVANKTINGITYSIVNGRMILNGTATTSFSIDFVGTDNNIPYAAGNIVTLSANATGSVTGTNSKLFEINMYANNDYYYMQISKRPDNDTLYPATKNLDIPVQTVFIWIYEGTTFENYDIGLQLESGSEATNYTKYNGGLVHQIDLDKKLGSYTYICSGEDDNIKISNIVKQWLNGGTDHNSMRINVVGDIGITNSANGEGTSSNWAAWFDFATTSVPTRKVILDFSACSEINLPIKDGTYNAVFGGRTMTIKNANIVANNTATDTAIKCFSAGYGDITVENSYFNITGYCDSVIAYIGTFINCYGIVTNQTTNSYCFTTGQNGLVRVNGGKYLAYTGTNTMQSAIIGQSQANTTSVFYGVNAPIIAKEGYYQTHSIVQTNGYINCTDLMSKLPLSVLDGLSSIRDTIVMNIPDNR